MLEPNLDKFIRIGNLKSTKENKGTEFTVSLQKPTSFAIKLSFLHNGSHTTRAILSWRELQLGTVLM